MPDITIKLTIGKETREVQARVFTHRPTEIVTWARVVTTHGTTSHVAGLTFTRNAADEYLLRECLSVDYPGKRGNGHARPSSFRSVSFLD